jgi:integrase
MNLLESYWKVQWPTYAPGQRSKVRGRLIVVAATLLDDSTNAQLVVDQLPKQSRSPGPRRLEPTSQAAWAARYLIDDFLPRPHLALAERSAELSEELQRASSWLAVQSLPASAIIDEDLVQLRCNLGGTTYNSRRSYWAIVEAMLHWAIKTGRLDHDPSIGIPKVRRIVASECIDPGCVPSESEIWAYVEAGRVRVGEWFAVAVLLGAYGAIRSGELMALRRESIRFTKDGGCWVTVSGQHRRFARQFSEDGHTTTDLGPPKGRVSGPAGRRRLYIPSRISVVIAPFVKGRVKEELLFVNVQGGSLDAGTFRDAWNRVKLTFPEHHRLRAMTPHSLRHAGMTMWMRQGLDLKLIQSWGGWHSLKVMLDTYAELLPGVEEETIALLEGRGTPSPFSFASSRGTITDAGMGLLFN